MIICGNCKDRHESVTQVKNCYTLSKDALAVLQQMAAPAPVTEPGMYIKGNVAYKVKWNQTKTLLYACRMVEKTVYGKIRPTFVYDSGAFKTLTADMRMRKDQAVEISTKYGVCCICGRTLTATKSVEDGIGPICAGRI